MYRGDYSEQALTRLAQAKGVQVDSGAIAEAAEMAARDTLEIQLDVLSRRGFRVFRAATDSGRLLEVAATENLRVVTRLRQSDRNQVVAGLIKILGEQTPYIIHRLDIRDFYGSLDTTWVVRRVREDRRVSRPTVRVVESLLRASASLGVTGLPRGLSLSALLGEDAMRRLDGRMRREAGVFYYARFVDDVILVISPHVAAEGLREKIRRALLFPGGWSLEFNLTKTTWGLLGSSGTRFEYLGYEISTSELVGSKRKPERRVEVSIAPSKVNRIKRKLSIAVAQYGKTREYALLRDRVRALASNYTLIDVDRARAGTVADGAAAISPERWVAISADWQPRRGLSRRVGIYYSYPLGGCHLFRAYADGLKLRDVDGKGTESRVLKALRGLDDFSRNLLTRTKTPASRIASGRLSQRQTEELLSFSFVAGFEERRLLKLTAERLGQVGRCWKNV